MGVAGWRGASESRGLARVWELGGEVGLEDRLWAPSVNGPRSLPWDPRGPRAVRAGEDVRPGSGGRADVSERNGGEAMKEGERQGIPGP